MFSPSISLPSVSHLLTIKLACQNDLLWKAQLLPYLNGQRLYSFVDGSRLPPPPMISTSNPDNNTPILTPNLGYTAWYQQDQLLLSAIVSSLPEEVLAQIVGLHTSREVWTTLEQTFSLQSQASVMNSRLSLASSKKGNLSVAGYFQKMKSYGDTLAAIGEPLADCELVSYILAFLGAEYDPLITSLTVCLDLMTLQEVYGHLLNYELRLEKQHATLD